MSKISIPWPRRGLSRCDFSPIGVAGLGDPWNAYPQSVEWFRDRLFVGTTRANLCMLRVSKVQTRLRNWPIECPESLYDLDMRAQIHTFNPQDQTWDEVFRSPMMEANDGSAIPRDMGYRCMTLFQGRSDTEPCLYVGTYASAKGRGSNILRSVDGVSFAPIPKPSGFGEFVTTLRLLVPFKGRLFTSPTGRAGGNPNAAFSTIVYETDDPLGGDWIAVSEPGFGDEENISIFEMAAFGDHLYAGTANFKGFQVWRTDAEGAPPYRWERLITEGGWRGRENQGIASFCVFDDALYLGSGIQHGGIDVVNKVGPAGAELIRIRRDGTWQLIVGNARETPNGPIAPLSGFGAGFDSFFNGYFWRMAAHDGWLYLGTFNWSLMLNYASSDGWPALFKSMYERLGPERVFNDASGAQLFRSADGENWLPVTTNGFDNPYNYGIRSLLSTPTGLVVGTVNPFGPRVGEVTREGIRYKDNDRGGLEIWLGRHGDRA